MPRIRTIKPEFFDSPHVASVSAVVRLAYIGLWCWADDTGRGTCNPKELEGFIFPHDDLSELSHGQFADFRGILPQLAAAFGVLFYTVDGRMFFDIPAWERHQRVRDKTVSRYPSPSEGELAEFCQKVPQSDNPPQPAATCRETPPGTGEQGNRGTDSYSPHLPPEQRDGQPNTSPPPASPNGSAQKRKEGKRLPDGWTPPDTAIEWAKREYPHINLEDQLAVFTDYWKSQSGAKSRKADWTATWRNWIRKASEIQLRDGYKRGYRSQAELIHIGMANAAAWDAQQEQLTIEGGAIT